MFGLAQELRDDGHKVLVTPTTKVFTPNKLHIDRLFFVDDVQALADICATLDLPATFGACCSFNKNIQKTLSRAQKLGEPGIERIVVTSDTGGDPVKEALFH